MALDEIVCNRCGDVIADVDFDDDIDPDDYLCEDCLADL